MPNQDFNPRAAALHHAAAVGEDTAARNHATAVACGLIYVGDQIGALTALFSEQNIGNNLSGVVGLLEQLDKTVNDRLIELTEAV